MLAPAKVEILNEDPLLALYHNVISDHDIETLQSMAENKFELAHVNKDGTHYASKNRVSSVAWLRDNDLKSTLQKRVAALTGLSLSHAEPLQMNRYGFGGFYHLHYDFLGASVLYDGDDLGPINKAPIDTIAGDRVLSDVEAGGATVFPALNSVVFPSKNDAIFWYNLNEAGYGISETLHSGCPVISGVKWVANQWRKERPRMFLRPCGLSLNE